MSRTDVQLQGSRVLADAMVQTSRALTVEDVCHGIGESVFALEPHSYVGVNLYVPAERCFRVVCYFGFGRLAAAGLRVLGKNPKAMRFSGELSEERRGQYTSGRLERVEGGLYELFSGQIPRTACTTFASITGIAETYHVGFAIDDVPYGGISVMLRHKDGIRHAETIESLASHTGVVIRQKHADDTRKETEGRYRMLFEQSLDAIYICDPDGATIDANHAWLDLFGYSRDELTAFKAVDLYADPRERVDFLRRLATTGHVRDEVRFKKKDGTEMDCERSVVARKDEHGKTVAVQGVVRDITGRKRMESDLRASSEQMSRLAHRVEQVREEERTELARELHDTAGQAITALKLDVSQIKKRLERGQAPTPEELGEVNLLLDRTADDVRRISSELRPGVLDDIGLNGAIQWQIDELKKRTDLEFTTSLMPDESQFDDARRTALFRVFQELLTNVVRHADARSVDVTLQRTDNAFTLTVADDGCGVAAGKLDDSSSIGIIGMRERLRPYGGELRYDSVPGKGTKARVIMPVE